MYAATALAGLLQLFWALFLATDSGDMAAQYAWAQFASAHPGSAYDLAWYGGMHPVSYSVLAPYLMALFGVRATAVIAGTLCAGLLARLVIRSGIRRPMVPALCGALALSCNTFSGRTTFGLGLCFAVAALLVVHETRGTPQARALAAGVLGVIATAASPVDGLFLLVVVPGLFLYGRRLAALALTVGPPLVVGATTLLFPFYGVQPFPLAQAALVVAVTLPLALLSPRSWRAVRLGAWVYLLGSLLTLVIPSPIGSNVERLALLFAAMVLLAAAMANRGRRATALWLAFAVALGWQCVEPLTDLQVTVPAAGWTQYAQPLVAELGRLGAGRARVEVVGAASHVEAATLTPYVELARGWNRQLDVSRNPLFYGATLTAGAYYAWLRNWAVGYVVLPRDVSYDEGSLTEAQLVISGQSWLRPVWSDAHWQVFRVADAQPMVSAPATVLQAGEAQLTVRIPAAGTSLVRIAWSPWLDLPAGSHGCLAPDGDWTRLTVSAPGTYRIGARYSLPRGSDCKDATTASG
ncbi:MFS transporter [Streptacidiphilus sp. P02-A3a]|nr:MFS transporter [Streptacidiphilus sp. P02-A3a]